MQARIEELRELQRSLLVGYGNVLRDQGLWHDAEDAYLSVLQADGNHTQAQLGLLFVLIDSGEDADCMRVLLERLTYAGVANARLWLEHGKQVMRVLSHVQEEFTMR